MFNTKILAVVEDLNACNFISNQNGFYICKHSRVMCNSQLQCPTHPTFPYIPEVKSRTQGSRPRPRLRTQKNSRPRTAFPRTDTLEAKDQGHMRKCSPKKTTKKGLHKNFSGDLLKKNFFQVMFTTKHFPKKFQALNKILTIQKIVLSSSQFLRT